jgi:hypothetical protein
MKKIFIYIITLVINATVFSQTNSAVTEKTETAPPPTAASKITGSFEMNYLRHYLWRGLLFGNNDVAQPELELSYKNFTLALAQNFNYVPKNVPKEIYTRNAIFDEQDVEIRYSKEWGRFSSEFSALAYFYFYQRGTPNTAELSNWTGYHLYKGFSLFTENTFDIANYRGGIYNSNGIVFEHTTKNNLTIEWSAFASFANAKFNSIYTGIDKGGLNLAGSHIEVTKDLGKYFIKIIGEKNIYTKPEIKESTGLNGTGNFGVAAGINF